MNLVYVVRVRETHFCFAMINLRTLGQTETTGEVPQQRANHSSALLEETGELFIFGGWNGNERLNDIHVLDTNTSTWTRPRVGGVLPHPRAGMTLTALRGRLFLFGGSGTSAKCFQGKTTSFSGTLSECTGP
jgi:leucine-zipper-like transcriptional regulator 1